MTTHKPWIFSHNTYMAATVGNFTLAENFHTLAPGAQEELFVTQLGDPSPPYMFILNKSSLEDAKLIVMIIN